MLRRALGVVAVAAGLAGAAGIAALPVAGQTVATGTLDMHTSLPLVSKQGGCELVGIATHCAARTVDGPFPGLGDVTSSYAGAVPQGPASRCGVFGRGLA